MLHILNLSVAISEKTILQDISLAIDSGQLHVIMGPNGSGKSSLAYTLMGHPLYEVQQGSVQFQGHNLLQLAIDKRSHLGLYLAMQQPPDIAGISVLSFFKELYHVHHGTKISVDELCEIIRPLLKLVGLSEVMLYRLVHEGFSGGEKKRFELLQMLLLQPKLAILDEIDSGVDVDGLKLIAQGLQWYRKQFPQVSIVIVTHYRSILQYLQPDFVHVLVQGRLVETGSAHIIDQIEQQGYDQYVQ